MDMALYVLVNNDIKISKGKLAGQVGHAVDLFFYHFYEQTEQRACSPTFKDVTRQKIRDYHQMNIKKIILKCPEEKLLLLEQEGYLTVRDSGFTQLAPNTLTCVCFGLFLKTEAPEWIQKLKLY